MANKKKFKFSEISLFKKVNVVEANDKTKKKTAKWRENVIVVSFMSIFLTFIGQGIALPFDFAVKSLQIGEDVNTCFMYFQFIGIWIVVLLYMLITKNNRVLLKYFKPGFAGNTLRNFIVGLAIGFGMNGFCILIAFICGSVSFELSMFNPLMIIACFVCVMIQSGAEELVDRGYLFRKLQRRYQRPWFTFIITSTVFTLLHLANPGMGPIPFIDIFMSGILFAAIVYYWNSFWGAVACHTAWNFTQNIIFGLPNSGQVTELNIFHLSSEPISSFAYNPAFGIEGTILAIVVQLIVVLCIIYFGERKLKNI